MFAVQVTGSILGRDTRYPDMFSRLSSVRPGQFWDITSTYHDPSHTLSTSVFTYHIIRHNIIRFIHSAIKLTTNK